MKNIFKILFKKNKTLKYTILISLGTIRIILNQYIFIKYVILKLVARKKNTIYVTIIGPIHSIHLKNFIFTFKKIVGTKKKVIFQLINSDPNSIVQNFNTETIIIDASIYTILGYRKDTIHWQKNLFLYAINDISTTIKNYVFKNIIRFEPDYFWVHDLQSAGYFISDKIEMYIRSLSHTKFIASIWGNDLYYFNDLELHNIKLRQLLNYFDFLHAESDRDEKISRKLGYSGIILPICSITLNDIEKFNNIKNSIYSNEKEYFLVISGSYYLRSNLFYLIDQIDQNPTYWINKKIVLIGASESDNFFFNKLIYKHSLKVEIFEYVTNDSLIKLFKKSKFHLICNLSDGIKNTIPEAVYANCLPIFTNNTGLTTMLPIEYSNLIVYKLNTVNFEILFTKIDKNKHIQIEILNNLEYIFESVVFNQNKYIDIFKKLEII